MAVDDVLEGAVMVAAMAALALESAMFWSLSRLVYVPPTPIAEPLVIYDTPSANVVYVDGVPCGECGGEAIATKYEAVCNNEGCALYGLPVRRQN